MDFIYAFIIRSIGNWTFSTLGRAIGNNRIDVHQRIIELINRLPSDGALRLKDQLIDESDVVRYFDRQSQDEGDRLKNEIIGEHHIVKFVNGLSSDHAITTVLTVIENGKLVDAILTSANGAAKKFYGKNEDATDLENKPGSFLMRILEEYMEKDDYGPFKDDQEEAFEHFVSQQPVVAKVPVIFNHKHKHKEFKGRVFLPVVINRGVEQRNNGVTRRLMSIAYFDLADMYSSVIRYDKRIRPTVSTSCGE